MDSTSAHFHIEILQQNEAVIHAILPADGSKNFEIERDGRAVLLIEVTADGSGLNIKNLTAGEFVLLNDFLLVNDAPLKNGDKVSLLTEVFTVRVRRVGEINHEPEAAAPTTTPLKTTASPATQRKPPCTRLVVWFFAALLAVLAAFTIWWRSAREHLEPPSSFAKNNPSNASSPTPEPTPKSRPVVSLRGGAPTLQSAGPEREPWSNEIWRKDLGSPVGCVAISADGSLAAAGTGNGGIHLIEPATGHVLAVLSLHEDSIASLALSADGSRLLAASYDGNASLWDVPQRKPLMHLGAHTAPLRAAAITPDGKRGLTGDIQGMIIYWNLQTGEDLRFLLGHDAPVNSVSFSPDGSLAASAGMDRKVVVWQLANGQKKIEMAFESGVNGVAFSPDGTTLAATLDGFLPSRNGVVDVPGETLRLLSTKDGTPLAPKTGLSEWLIALAYSPDGAMLAVTTGGNPDPRLSTPGPCLLKLWETRNGRIIKSISAHTRLVSGVAFLPDGRSAITSSLDHTVRRW